MRLCICERQGKCVSLRCCCQNRNQSKICKWKSKITKTKENRIYETEKKKREKTEFNLWTSGVKFESAESPNLFDRWKRLEEVENERRKHELKNVHYTRTRISQLLWIIINLHKSIYPGLKWISCCYLGNNKTSSTITKIGTKKLRWCKCVCTMCNWASATVRMNLSSPNEWRFSMANRNTHVDILRQPIDAAAASQNVFQNLYIPCNDGRGRSVKRN